MDARKSSYFKIEGCRRDSIIVFTEESFQLSLMHLSKLLQQSLNKLMFFAQLNKCISEKESACHRNTDSNQVLEHSSKQKLKS